MSGEAPRVHRAWALGALAVGLFLGIEGFRQRSGLTAIYLLAGLFNLLAGVRLLITGRRLFP
jgi:hypothetical protein